MAAGYITVSPLWGTKRNSSCGQESGKAISPGQPVSALPVDMWVFWLTSCSCYYMDAKTLVWRLPLTSGTFLFQLSPLVHTAVLCDPSRLLAEIQPEMTTLPKLLPLKPTFLNTSVYSIKAWDSLNRKQCCLIEIRFKLHISHTTTTCKLYVSYTKAVNYMKVRVRRVFNLSLLIAWLKKL